MEKLTEFLDKEPIDNFEEESTVYSFNLKGISEKIYIRVFFSKVRNMFECDQSHFIKTPNMPNETRSSSMFGDDEQEALRRAISNITSDYTIAVGKGNIPSCDWLCKNQDY